MVGPRNRPACPLAVEVCSRPCLLPQLGCELSLCLALAAGAKPQQAELQPSTGDSRGALLLPLLLLGWRCLAAGSPVQPGHVRDRVLHALLLRRVVLVQLPDELGHAGAVVVACVAQRLGRRLQAHLLLRLLDARPVHCRVNGTWAATGEAKAARVSSWEASQAAGGRLEREGGSRSTALLHC